MKTKVLAAIVVAAVSASAFSQQNGFYSDGRPERIFNPVSGLGGTDTKFLKAAQIGNQFEIMLSKLAVANTSDPFVKQFAQEMIGDHGAAKDEVSQVATSKSVNVTGELPLPMQAKLNKLEMLKGTAFDNAFRSIQKESHQDAIQLYKMEIRNGRDQDVKAVAVKLLPTIELHYRMLLNGKTMMGSTAATNGQ